MRVSLFWVLVGSCAACSEPVESRLQNVAQGENTGRDANSAAGSDGAAADAGGAGSSNAAAGAGGANTGSDAAAAGAGGAAGASTQESGAGGGAGSAAGGAAAGGAAGQGVAPDPCPTPAGDPVVVSAYVAPMSAQGCDLQPSIVSSVNVQSEAEFLELFSCPEQAASGIDFDSQRLRVTVIREAGFLAATRHHAVQNDGVLELGFELPRYCGGAFPPTGFVLTLIPADPETVEDEVCRPGDCGAGGFPP